MTDDERWDRLIGGLRAGDSLAAREFYAQYGPVLQRIADRHLPNKLRRRIGPEDVVQSACRTFLRRAEGGEFHFTDDTGLWQLLCAITLTKVREQTRFHLRQKRMLSRETEPDSAASQSFGHAASGPTPDDVAAFSEQLERLLADLDDEERQIVHLKLQEFTHDQVAEQVGCSERTVRRTLKRLQARFATAFEAT